jgi:hypothetical protein
MLGAIRNPYMVITAVCISNLPMVTIHFRDPIMDWYCATCSVVHHSDVSLALGDLPFLMEKKILRA